MSSTNQRIRSLCNEGSNNNFWLTIHRALNVTADVLHVFCINRKETTNIKKKNNVFFKSAFTLLISTLSFTLLIILFDNLPISLDGICTHVSIKVETYYILLNHKLKIKFYTRWNPNWFEKYKPSCNLPFFSVPK